MTHKSTACYEHVFKYIEEHVMTLQCASFTTDYEIAMRKRLSKIHPEVKRYACFFHFCQAVKKHAYKTYGMSNIIKSNCDARLVYYRLMLLPLLPHEMINSTFLHLKNEAYAVDKTVFRPFIRYFQKQWIEKVCFMSNICLCL